MNLICCHDVYVWKDADSGRIFHMSNGKITSHECDDEEMPRLLEPINNMEGFVQSRQRRGHQAVQIRDDLMKRGYDLHAAAGLVAMYWSDAIARDMVRVDL